MKEHEEQEVQKDRQIGPIRIYRGFKRDLMVTVGLIVLLLVLKMMN